MFIPRASAVLLLLLVAVSVDSAGAQMTAPRAILVEAPLNYDFDRESGSLQPSAGKRFVGIALAKTDTVQIRFRADSAVLATSPGERLAPTAFCADAIGKSCIPTALLRPGQIFGAYGETGEGYSLVRNASTGAIILARRGPKDSPFVLVYEVPAETRQVTFTFGSNAGVALQLPARE
jgi:hypothetical protein